LEVRALADVRRKLRQLVHPDLKHVTWGQITIQSLRLSHVERLEVRALADVRRKLRELVVADLKKTRDLGSDHDLLASSVEH
jgi:hypothetical protein